MEQNGMEQGGMEPDGMELNRVEWNGITQKTCLLHGLDEVGWWLLYLEYAESLANVGLVSLELHQFSSHTGDEVHSIDYGDRVIERPITIKLVHQS